MRVGFERATRWLVVALMGYLSAAAGVGNAADLIDLYGMAQTSDPTFQSARSALQAAKQKRPEAFSALLPALSASASDGRTLGRTRYSDTPEISRGFNSDQWTLQLTQPLFRADRLLAYDEARATVEQSLAQYSAAQQDLMLRLSRAYFDEIVAQRHVLTTRAQVDAMHEQEQAARRSFQAGVASVTDVDDARSHASLAEAQRVGAMNDLESTRAALEAIIGESPAGLAPLKVAAVLPEPDPADIGIWVQRAVEDNPSVQAAEAVLKGAGFELERARAQRLPSLDLVASYGGNYAGGNITEPTNFDTNVRDRQVSIQVSMPLLDGGGMHAQVAEARALRSKAQSDLSAARRKATLDARQAYAAVLSGVAQVHALEVAVSAGQSAVKGNRIGYGLGIRINSDVLNAEQQLYSAMQDLDKARYDTLYEGLQLKAAIGALSDDDLKGIDALLEPGVQTDSRNAR